MSGLIQVKKMLKSFTASLAPGYLRKWVPLSILIGVAAGLSAAAFYAALKASMFLFLYQLAGYIPPSAAGEGEEAFTLPLHPYMIPIITTMGGFISGLLVYRFAPEAEGHGTDAAIDAFHNKAGVLRARVPIIKMIASAVTIGSGGSAGKEGPIALTSAGFASILGKLLKLNTRDRRTAVAAGIGAGIGSIFKAPFGGAILAAEILYLWDFEVQAIVPAFIASVTGYTIFASINGWQPIFAGVKEYYFHEPVSLLFYSFLGGVCGLIGILYIKSFYGMKTAFDKLKIPPALKPAIGGLLTGMIGMFFPYVLETGYGWLQKAINGDLISLPILAAVALIFLKILATSFTVGSGGSGGVYAPALMIGGMTGLTVWAFFNSFGVVPEPSPAPYVIVGMMSFFGGVGKAPIAVILMVSEMTGTYSLLVPSMLSTIIAYVMTGRRSIYSKQVQTRADSPAHITEYAVPLLQKIKVRDAMTRNLITIHPDASAAEAARLMAEHEIKGIPVVDSGNRLKGMVTFSDVLRLPPEKRENTKVSEIMTCDLIVTFPHESLYEAFEKMAHYQIGRLPVLESLRTMKLVGIITRGDVGRVYELKFKHMLESSEELSGLRG